MIDELYLGSIVNVYWRSAIGEGLWSKMPIAHASFKRNEHGNYAIVWLRDGANTYKGFYSYNGEAIDGTPYYIRQ